MNLTQTQSSSNCRDLSSEIASSEDLSLESTLHKGTTKGNFDCTDLRLGKILSHAYELLKGGTLHDPDTAVRELSLLVEKINVLSVVCSSSKQISGNSIVK